ncbi:MAG: manganese efflux pump MntP family protein [Methanomicrobiales archaeon]|nr:manganese efflux pump MntP family protein [Methanomicrobiales archaeon]
MIDTPSLLLIGVGLAMDCFAISLAAGTTRAARAPRAALTLALSFGLFQAGMTLFGWGAGSWVVGSIAGFAPLIAFGLLTGVGLKILVEAWRGGEEVREIRGILTIFVLSVATSLDALAVGLSFAVFSIDIVWAALLIGCMASLFSSVGLYLGGAISRQLGKHAEALGGVILITIGIKILIEYASATPIFLY